MPESNTPTNKPRSFRVQIEINDQQAPLKGKRRILQACRQVLRDAGVRSGSLSIALVSDSTIAELNQRYLDHQGPTDVLSFCLQSDRHRQYLEAEIVVSVDTARRQAPHYGWKVEDEVLLYVIHGALHLVGYNDGRPEDRRQMRRMEHQYLAAFNLTPAPDSQENHA